MKAFRQKLKRNEQSHPAGLVPGHVSSAASFLYPHDQQYWATFFAFELAVLVSWIALIWRGTFALKRAWILASPLIVAGIGYLAELLIPWPFNGFVSGFESFGWMLMFFGGRKLVSQEIEKRREGVNKT